MKSLEFPPFSVDPSAGRLLRNGTEVRLRRKTWEVLRYLLERPGQLVTNEELLRHVWEGLSVSTELPAVSVREIRRALDDVGPARRFVETVHGRGFRFVAELTAPAGASREPAIDKPPRSTERRVAPAPVGRESELARLEAALRDARDGSARIAWLEGESGVGKSSVIDALMQRALKAGGAPALRIARGVCIPSAGEPEELLPVWAALSDLARGGGRAALSEELARLAPWCAGRLALDAPTQPTRPPRERARRLHEVAEALVSLALRGPLALVLEDVDAADPATLDLIEALLRRADEVALFVLVSAEPTGGTRCRLSELAERIASARNGCVVTLRRLDAAVAARLLRQRLELPASPELVALVEAYAGGLPAAMTRVTEWLLEIGARHRADGRADLDREVLSRSPLPAGLRAPLVDQLASLPPTARDALEVAATIGDAFEARTVAGALGLPEQHGAPLLERLERERGLLRRLEDADDPVYAFASPLTRALAYESMPGARRRTLHLEVARQLEREHRGAEAKVAAELAMQFRLGGDARAAARYQLIASAVARRRGTHREAMELLEEATRLLPYLDPAERRTAETHVELGRAAALTDARGPGDPDARAACRRAYELAAGGQASDAAVVALDGLFAGALAAGEVAQARAFADEIDRHANEVADPALRLCADARLGEVLLLTGDARRALGPLRSARRATATAAQRGGALVTYLHPAVLARSHGAIAAWLVGRPDEAIELADESIAIARELDHAPAIAFALDWAAALRLLCGELDAAARLAAEADQIATDAGLAAQRAIARVLGGFAEAFAQDRRERRARARARALRTARTDHPFVMAAVAELALRDGDHAAAADAIERGLATTATGFGRALSPELTRLSACVAAARGEEGAESSLREAREAAKRAGLAALALRASITWAPLLARAARHHEAAAQLSEDLAEIRGGASTRDVREAQAALSALSPRAAAAK